jgi:hypothetical protein
LTGVHLHRAAGLTIAADRPVPGLSLTAAHATADLHLHFQASPRWGDDAYRPFHRASATDAAGQPVVSVDASPNGYRFRYADGTSIWLDAVARHVWCTWSKAATLEDVCTYVVGPILAFALRLRGALALHASAVEVGGRAIALVGPHGAGKSTVAAALARLGHAVVTDDVLRLRRVDSEWLAEPFAGVLRLWPESARLVLGSSDTLPRITPSWDKRALAIGAHGTRPCEQIVPLAGIVFLDPREPGCAAPRLVPTTERDALLRLATNSSAAHLLDRRHRAVEFIQLGALVRDIPALAAVARQDPGPAAFDTFILRIVEWFDRLTPTS